MTAWTLTATGACAPEDERDLADKLNRLLATGKYGVTGSQLSGETHNGPVHQPKKAKA